MSNRVRTVHPADMVAHLWAHKSQDFARNPGHFALDAVDARGNVRAGCHEVAWEEITRVATLAGVN